MLILLNANHFGQCMLHCYIYNDNEERIQDFISSFAVFKGLTLKQIIAENNMAVETMEEVFKDLLK